MTYVYISEMGHNVSRLVCQGLFFACLAPSDHLDQGRPFSLSQVYLQNEYQLNVNKNDATHGHIFSQMLLTMHTG